MPLVNITQTFDAGRRFYEGENVDVDQTTAARWLADGKCTLDTDGAADSPFLADVTKRLRQYGARFDGTTDDHSAIQKTIDWFASRFPRYAMPMPEGAGSARLASTLVIDMSKTSIDFNQLRLLPDAGATAIRTTGSDTSPHDQAATFLRNFHIVGPTFGVADGTRGIFHHNPDGVSMGGGASRFTLQNYSIRSCDIGEDYGNTAWGIVHLGWTVHLCNTAAVRMLTGYADGYESPTYYGGVMANNINGWVMTAGQIAMLGGSNDYNRTQGTITNARLHLIGTHDETDQKRESYPVNHVPWVLSGTGALVKIGGRLNTTQGSGTNAITHMFDVSATNPNANGGVFLENVSINNMVTTSGYMAKGTGQTFATRCIVEMPGGATGGVWGVHETDNLLSYGGAEDGAIPTDDVFVNGGTMTSRLVNDNITVSDGGAVNAHSGTHQWLITKNSATTTSGTADFCAFKRISDIGRQHSGSLWVRAPSSTVQITVQFGYFSARPTVVGTDVLYTMRSIVTTSLTLDGANALSGGNLNLSSAWRQVRSLMPFARPGQKGADYVGFRVRFHNLAIGETAYVDDIEIHPW